MISSAEQDMIYAMRFIHLLCRPNPVGQPYHERLWALQNFAALASCSHQLS